MKLYSHQIKLLERNPNKTLLCWDTGTGKTIGALELMYQKKGETLVICPKALKANWKRNIKPYHHRAMEDEVRARFNVDVMSKEEFRRDWKKIKKYQNLIVDEAHYFAGMRNWKSVSQMAKSLVLYIKENDPAYITLLTATPYLSTPYNIFMLAKILGHKWNYRAFKENFFEEIYIGRRIIPKVKDGMEGVIADLVAEIGDVVDINECIDVPEQVYDFETFELTKAQEARKKKIIEVNPVVRYTRYHQIENGTLKSDGYTEDEFIKADKNDRIYELCEQTKKIAVVCRYNLQIDFLKEFLKDIGKPVLVIRGDVKDRDSVIQEAENSSHCIILINASCSEGYELPSIGLIIFASVSFSYKDYKQITGRFLRINKPKKNVFVHLVSEGVDESVFEAIMAKKDFDIEIYARNT